MRPSVTTAPTIETARLQPARPPRRRPRGLRRAVGRSGGDAPHQRRAPFTREEVWARLLRHVGHWSLLGHGFWPVEEPATGAFVGEVGLADFKRDRSSRRLTAPEAGWVLAPGGTARGYAIEAMTAALAWTEAAMGFVETCASSSPANAASLAVAGAAASACRTAPPSTARRRSYI